MTRCQFLVYKAIAQGEGVKVISRVWKWEKNHLPLMSLSDSWYWYDFYIFLIYYIII